MDKLIKIQSELKAPKGQYNSFGKYKYRSAEDILEAVKPLCVKHNVLLTLTDSIELIGERYYVKATARVSDGTKAVEVTALAREDLDKKGMDGSQITGTASSYARKYALNGLFCIDDTKDADTDEYAAKTQGKTDPDAKKDAEKKKELETTAISAAEAKTLKGLIEMTGTDEKKLLKSYKAATIEALSKAQWAQAVKILSDRKEKQTSEVQDALFG